jgi:hypothetical protein
VIDINLLLVVITAAAFAVVGFYVGCMYTERKCLKVLELALPVVRHGHKQRKKE